MLARHGSQWCDPPGSHHGESRDRGDGKAGCEVTHPAFLSWTSLRPPPPRKVRGNPAMSFTFASLALAASTPFDFLFHTWSFQFMGRDIFAHDNWEQIMYFSR